MVQIITRLIVMIIAKEYVEHYVVQLKQILYVNYVLFFFF